MKNDRDWLGTIILFVAFLMGVAGLLGGVSTKTILLYCTLFLFMKLDGVLIELKGNSNG